MPGSLLECQSERSTIVSAATHSNLPSASRTGSRRPIVLHIVRRGQELGTALECRTQSSAAAGQGAKAEGPWRRQQARTRPAARPRTAGAAALPLKLILIALCMAQFINAYDTTAMNVAVTSVVKSLDTTVSGVQSALVLYSLVMASFMLIGGKLGDVWGRRATFTLGISMYGVGALITALQHGPADDDLRLVAARGPGLGADDPGDLRHRRHHLPGRQAARLGVRRRRRDGRHGRGSRAAHLRLPHHLPHLARLVPAGGLRRHRHARALDAHQGAQAAAAQGAARLPRRLSLRARPGARRARRAAGEQVRLDGRQRTLRRLGQDADPRGRHLAGHPVRHRRRRRAAALRALGAAHAARRQGRAAQHHHAEEPRRAVRPARHHRLHVHAGRASSSSARCSCRWRSATPPSTAAC